MSTSNQCNASSRNRHNRTPMYLPETLAAATRDVNELFDRLFDGPSRDASRPSPASPNSWAAPASVWEEDGNFHIALDLPGINLDELDVTVDDGNLVVTASRKAPENRQYVHNERKFGELNRMITLPDTVDPESIEAEYTGGVLKVRLSKRPEVLPRKVEVKFD